MQNSLATCSELQIHMLLRMCLGIGRRTYEFADVHVLEHVPENRVGLDFVIGKSSMHKAVRHEQKKEDYYQRIDMRKGCIMSSCMYLWYSS